MTNPSDNPRAVIGANNPPDPIEAVDKPFYASSCEAVNWLDGTPIETEGQMQVVDGLRADQRKRRMALEVGQKAEAEPLHAAHKAALARWAPAIADAKMMEAGLVALVDGFKRQLAAEKEAKRQAAWAASEAARREAEAKIAAADAGNIEAQREAKAAMDAADLARAQASIAQKDVVKGLRWYDCHEILDYRAAINWIATNDKPAMKDFIDAYVAKNATRFPTEVVRNWKEQRAV